jgi:hypothetical protein
MKHTDTVRQKLSLITIFTFYSFLFFFQIKILINNLKHRGCLINLFKMYFNIFDVLLKKLF